MGADRCSVDEVVSLASSIQLLASCCRAPWSISNLFQIRKFLPLSTALLLIAVNSTIL